MSNIIAWMVRHPVAANLLMALLLAAGLFNAYSVEQKTFPDTTIDAVEIQVEYRGASPAEILESIIQRIEEQVTSLDGMGDSLAGKLLKGIEVSKTRGLARLLNALSIRHVGVTVATVLAEHYGSMTELSKATVEELSEVDEIGEIIAASVHEFIHSDVGSATIEALTGAGVMMTQDKPVVEKAGDSLDGKSFVVTGKLTKYTRDEIQGMIKAYGGKASSSVSSKTDYLVAGEKAGSKLAKAEKLGVEVLTEDEFEKLIAEQA